MNTPSPSMPTLLTPEQAAAFLQVPVTTLSVWRCTGRVALPYLKVGGHVRYRREEIERFLSQHEVRPAASPLGPAQHKP